MFALVNTINVPVAMWSVLISTLIPPVTGFLTKLSTTAPVKAGITLFLNLLNVAISTVVISGDHAVVSKNTIVTAIVSYVVSSRFHSDFWKPKGITSSAIAVPDPVNPGQTINIPGSLATKGVSDQQLAEAA